MNRARFERSPIVQVTIVLVESKLKDGLDRSFVPEVGGTNFGLNPQMWTPADKSALPTLDDLEKARDSINLVQIDLDIAIEQLAQAQIRVDTLRRDLKKRKAWVALVRRLPFDVLSAIFVWCASVDWDSPVRIVGVCRVWREVILETPTAWSFVDLYSEMPAEGINMFFERSRQVPLHISLPKSTPFELLSSMAHRICCLTLLSLSSLPSNAVFPSTRRLSIPYRRGGMPLSFVNTHRFPALIHLATPSTSVYGASSPSTSNFVFPPLKSWRLCVGLDLSWSANLSLCQNTLVSLSLHDHVKGRLVVKQQILLPALKYLQLFARDTLKREVLDLKTPVLETYTEYVSGTKLMESPIHTDINTAREMRFNNTPSLSYCAGVQRLQLFHSTSNEILAVLQQLAVDSGISPALQIIELVASDRWVTVAPHMDALFETNCSRSRPIRLIVSSDESTLPGVIPVTVRLFTLPLLDLLIHRILQCEDGMPCLDFL